MKPHHDFRRRPSLLQKIKTFFFAAFIAFIGINAGAVWFQNQLTEKILTRFQRESSEHGVQLREVTFRCAGLVSPNTLRWKKIRGQVQLGLKGVFSQNKIFYFEVKTLDVTWAGLFPSLLEVRVSGLRMLSDRAGTEGGERLEDGMLQFKVPFPVWSSKQIRREAGALFHQGISLLRRGKSSLGLEFKASVFFKIREVTLRAGIESQRIQAMTSLRMPVQDLITISAVLDEALTSHEIRLLSQNPLYAPELLQIRNYARSTAYYAGKSNSEIPKDAYRHILWSYLLTRAFGEKFSRQVTEAHEINPVLENTPAQLKMDENNNAVGRRYARLGYEESSLLNRLMKDPAVIRYSTDSAKR